MADQAISTDDKIKQLIASGLLTMPSPNDQASSFDVSSSNAPISANGALPNPMADMTDFEKTNSGIPLNAPTPDMPKYGAQTPTGPIQPSPASIPQSSATSTAPATSVSPTLAATAASAPAGKPTDMSSIFKQNPNDITQGFNANDRQDLYNKMIMQQKSPGSIIAMALAGIGDAISASAGLHTDALKSVIGIQGERRKEVMDNFDKAREQLVQQYQLKNDMINTAVTKMSLQDKMQPVGPQVAGSLSQLGLAIKPTDTWFDLSNRGTWDAFKTINEAGWKKTQLDIEKLKADAEQKRIVDEHNDKVAQEKQKLAEDIAKHPIQGMFGMGGVGEEQKQLKALQPGQPGQPATGWKYLGKAEK